MSSKSRSKKKMVTLKSRDGEIFEVEEAAALQLGIVKRNVELDCAGTIPLDVRSAVLSEVMEYCKKHVEPSNNEMDIQDWDKKFMEVDIDKLYDLITAANYLHIDSLLDLACETVADMVKGKTAEEIRTIFNIENDFTPEEEEAARKDRIEWWPFD